MTAVGEIFLSAFLQVLFQQLATGAMMALARREKVERHFRKLRDSLAIVRGVLDDAEEKQVTEKSVKAWLEMLRDVAFDLDDVLDEITTRALIQGSKGIRRSRSNPIWRLIPKFRRYMPGALIANYRMMSRIKEISSRLQENVNRRIKLNLRENQSPSFSRHHIITRLPTTSLNESHVYGRDKDKEFLIQLLLSNEGSSDDDDDVQVIPIVGMGGIGKTTLAQLVYNDREVKQNFHKRAWICVDVVFDVVAITKTILESVTDATIAHTDLNSLQVRLQQELSKNKFFIVLDDVWNKNYEQWDRLCRPFSSGLPGSRIIVTTRDESIASVVGSPRKAHHMKLLTDEDCLLLLAQHSRVPLGEESEFRDVGLGLMKKCRGLPLAAKTLGGFLRKESKEGWEKVLKSKIWDLPEEENNIPPVLRLSYYHLPSHLKHLFAYCSIFPKDYEFDPNELVQLWMAEGFLEQPEAGQTKEDLGHDYFRELMLRSFFQRSGEGSNTLFVMHDLINDLAQFVAVGSCYRLDEKMDTNQVYQVPPRTRHGSFLRHEYEVVRKFKDFSRVGGLRTFLPMPIQNSLVWPPFYMSNTILVELVPKLLRLRVLSLSGYSITEVPGSVCGLIHIRYLNLSGTLIAELPDSVGDLLRLETLLLSNCRFISKLPSTLGNLCNLRHLDNSNTEKLKDMPVEIGKLKDLQTLPKIVLSRVGDGLGLKDLRLLKMLRGTVSILELQNVMDTEDVKEANLGSKEKLEELQLTWGSDVSDGAFHVPCSQEEVIDLLRPHENLKSLRVESYRGLRFPSWIGDPLFSKLSSISIDGCSECSLLPPFGQLPELKTLRIQRMSKVKRVGKEFYGRGAPPFPKLETLRFNHMPEWEEWSSASTDGEDPPIEFPCLQNLAMFKCRKLTRVNSPLSFPCLRGLDLEDCNKVVLESFCNLSSLSFLKVESVKGLSHLPSNLMPSLTALEVLECCNCKDMVSIWPDVSLTDLTRLKRIVIADCSQLAKLGQGDQHFPCNLEVIELFLCPNITALPRELSSLGFLRELIIKNCSKFYNFPETGIPPTLKRLEILSCNALVSLPSNISSLERLEIKDCSSLKTWAGNRFPVSLKKLAVKNCTSLDSPTFPEDEATVSLEELSLFNWPNFRSLINRLNGFSRLIELNLSRCSGLKHIPDQGLPPNLRALSIEHCGHLKSLPAKIQTMSSLLSLEVRSCSKLNNFPQCDLPRYLTYLRIWDSKNFKPLKQWGLHRLTSLREFSICGGFKELELLGDDDLFPPSLEKFSIARFPKLVSLGKVLENLESLRHLSIMNCGVLDVLPSESLLERLWHLEISECTVLGPKCARERGEYWSKIGGIPCVEVDGTYVYRQNLA